MKDRINNRLAVGDKVVVALPEPQIFGFVSKIEEGGLVTGVRAGGAQKRVGRVLISAVIAIPVDPELDLAVQLVKVYDSDNHEDGAEKVRPN